MSDNYNIYNINELSFNNMVDEVYKLNSFHHEKKKRKIKLPNFEVEIEVNRLYWKNVNNFLIAFNRTLTHDHFLIFLQNELNNKEINWLSANSLENGLIIHQKHPKLNILKEVINKYIDNFVICPSCYSSNTIINKFINKKYKFVCNECGVNKCI